MSTIEEKRLQNKERFENKKRKVRESQIDGPYRNPCYEEGQMTIRCVSSVKNKTECEKYAANAMKCKTFWKKVVKDRKRKGIDPPLPAIEDRPQVLEQYKHWL
ncbi:coiled-coil-helix-coiled-coil-helix domain-containing protein 7-like [Mercenaria mercenaria]|uniref:coiled-coil-helix-coiled-coil-helix domain-containing protein 7-like n=1 Tax=Mercenaria mercenaria TaxID=6596 RepID=UPI001E1D25AD|nr:coiled-coil-helix-coiled-coil-helix domain-containing protein 7-like [Mercenaria mercenaria]